MNIKSAIMGTANPRALLLEAGVAGMQRKAGYQVGRVDTSSDLWQHTLDGSKVLIEMDVQKYIDAWYSIVDRIIDVLTDDDKLWVWYTDIPEWNRQRIRLERVLNRANIRRVPHFWEYIFSQGIADYLPPIELTDFPEYPRNEAELDALIEKYGAQS